MIRTFGKCATKTVCHAVILQVLHYSCHFVKSIPGAKELPRFHAACQKIVTKLPEDTFEISSIILERAMKLTAYFEKHKLIFSGYHLDPFMEIHEIYDKLVVDAASKLEKQPTIKDLDGRPIMERS